MQFFLITTLTTSSDIQNLEHNVIEFINEANNTFLTKGAPLGEGAKSEILDIKGKNIKLLIKSGRYVRSHDALLRIKKKLAFYLGSNFKIGIRAIIINEFKIIISSDEDLTNKNIPYVNSISFSDNKLTLELDIGENEIKNQIPDRILNLVEDKIRRQKYGSKSEHWNILWESNDKKFNYFIDPTIDMLNRGWLQRGTNRGQWIYGPKITKIFRTFERIVEKELLQQLNFNEMIFPKLVTWDVWKHSGHANGIYPEIYYVCAPKTRDPTYWEDVMDYYKVTREIPINLIKEKISDPIGGLCYAQCPPAWTYFQGKTISNNSIPIKVYDKSGTSHRYESGGIHGIERVDEFHRLEIIWVGTENQVISIADELHEKYKYIFNEILELKWRKAWVTPWFMAQEGILGLSEVSKVGTTDYEAPLPYRGIDSEWLEFQNLSINGEKYPNGFNVKLQNGTTLWSGCSGVGFERWASVFLAQHSLDISNWPEKFVEYFGKFPQDIQFL